MLEEQILRYGLRERIMAVRAITSSPADLVASIESRAAFERFINQFCSEVQPLVDQGVEMIIPGGGLPAILLSRMKNLTVGNGVPVLEPIAVLAKMMELAVKLRRLNGTSVSRAGTFAKASDKALEEFLSTLPQS